MNIFAELDSGFRRNDDNVYWDVDKKRDIALDEYLVSRHSGENRSPE